MQQQPQASPKPLSRLIPTRRAALALWALDAALVALPMLIRWHRWFAFAYLPLLITVALGALMGGRGRLATILTGIVIPIVMGSLWVVLKLSSPSMDLLGTVLHAGAIALACLGVVWLWVAVWGWVRFFAGQPAAA